MNNAKFKNLTLIQKCLNPELCEYKILCLPLHDLTFEDIDFIVEKLKKY